MPAKIALPTDPTQRVSLLARTGFHEQAEELLRAWPGSAAESLPALVDITLAKGAEIAGNHDSALEAWLQEQDARGLAFDALTWLARFDQQDLLALPLAQRLLEIAGDQLSRLPPDYINSWDLRQQLAAHRARTGRLVSARELVAATDPKVLVVATPLVYEDAERGWAWRGLALLRLGDRPAAEAAFDQAVAIASRPAPRSRTYEEWRELALTFSLADDWRRSFETFHGPADGRARVIQGLELIELWAEHRDDIAAGKAR